MGRRKSIAQYIQGMQLEFATYTESYRGRIFREKFK
jgi:hypothetical protein